MDLEPEIKKTVVENSNESNKRCKHFVIRKKRFCKMTVAKGKEYCGEHCPINKKTSNNCNKNDNENDERILCPLDSKHTIYKKNLKKHLKICNARQKNYPKYILPGVNSGEDDNNGIQNNESIKLSDLNEQELKELTEKIKNIYEKYIKFNICELILKHDIMDEEINKKEYGQETRKHLLQTSSILGYLDHYNLIQDNTTFIEFGAGKGQLSYWLAQAINKNKNSKVLLIDRASHRHKKDNKIEDRSLVHRIRADIADLNIKNIDLMNDTKNIVAVSKHLCGQATDLTLRCILLNNKSSDELNIKPKEMELNSLLKLVKGFVIALCCHHRCEWKSFVGKNFFKENNLSQNDFNLMIKMVSWAICGTGYSRERRKEIERNQQNQTKSDELIENNENQITNKLSLENKKELGLMCKRIIDYSRLNYMERNGFKCYLKYYVDHSITLENCCLLGILNEF